MVLDPPYAGAAEQVGLLARAAGAEYRLCLLQPRRAGRGCQGAAAAGYRVTAATPVDQFLWSPHLEAWSPSRVERPAGMT